MDAKPFRVAARPGFARRTSALRRSPRGFTLVELLVVIVIIGILAGLVTAAAIPAIRRAKRLTITNEINQISTALEKYKQDFGDYPPDFMNVNDTNTTIRDEARNVVFRHLQKAFPRYRLVGATTTVKWDNLRLAVKRASMQDPGLAASSPDGLDITNLDPGSALLFWLGGPRDFRTGTNRGATKLVGFSANPSDPFAIGGSRLPVMFEFDERRLIDDTTKKTCSYVPPHVVNPEGGIAPPYVYFRARLGGYNGYPSPTGDTCSQNPSTNPPPIPWFTHTGSGTCFPYADQWREDTTVTPRQYRIQWMKPQTFQIICAGLDGEYGPKVTDPTKLPDLKIHCFDTQQNNLDPLEDDNLTSFTQGMLEDGVQ